MNEVTQNNPVKCRTITLTVGDYRPFPPSVGRYIDNPPVAGSGLNHWILGAVRRLLYWTDDDETLETLLPIVVRAGRLHGKAKSEILRAIAKVRNSGDQIVATENKWPSPDLQLIDATAREELARVNGCAIESLRQASLVARATAAEIIDALFPAWYPLARLFELIDSDWLYDRVMNGIQSGEAIIYNVRDPRFSTDGEGTKLDEGVSDKRLLIHEEELARLLAVASRQGNSISAVLREAWDGKYILRNNGKISPDVATEARISLIGHITRANIEKCLKDVETANGFVNRILWVAAHRSKRIAIPEGINWSKESSIIAHLQDVVATFQGVKRELRFSQEAEGFWKKWYDGLDDQKSGLIDNILARAEAHVLRLSMIYALLDNVALIKIEHLRAAIAVWEYCERSAKWIFGNRTGDKIADKILFALERAPDGLSLTSIGNDVLSKNYPKVDIHQALESLEDAGLAKHVKIATEGAAEETIIFYAPKFEDCVNLRVSAISKK